jgi:N-dimethylarginine dimethylaminohydrolase
MLRPEKTLDYKKLPFYGENNPFGTFGNLCETVFPDFLDEIRLLPNTWGAQGIGRLRRVIMHRPGDEVLEAIELAKKDPEIARLLYMQDTSADFIERTQEQFDEYILVLKGEGVEIEWLNPDPPLVNWYGLPIPNLSSIGLTLPNGGFIQERGGMIHKFGKHWYWYRRFAELGIPTLLTVTGTGIFEFPNVRWIDNESCIIATSIRTNMEGINQVVPVLHRAGTREIHIAHLPKATAFHLDIVFGMADHDLGVVYPAGLDYYTIRYLEDRGIRLVEASKKETDLCAPNLLVIKPGRVILPTGCEMVAKKLRLEGTDVIEVDLNTFAPGSGPTCLPGVLIRDDSFPEQNKQE